MPRKFFQNSSLAKLRDGDIIIGGDPIVHHAKMVDFVASEGWDWMFIDCEHGGSFNGDVLWPVIRACEENGITPLVRVPILRYEYIAGALDLGAHGVIIPHVNTPGDAKAAVDAAKYAPLGKRGYGGIRGKTLDEANAQVMVAVMPEEKTAIDNLTEIASTPGVDVCFIGPHDLAASMGYGSDIDDGAVVETIAGAIEEIRRCGAIAGMVARDPEELLHYKGLGVQFFQVSMGWVYHPAAEQFLDASRGKIPAPHVTNRIKLG